MASEYQVHRVSAAAECSNMSSMTTSTDGPSANVRQPCSYRQAASIFHSPRPCSRLPGDLESNGSRSHVQQASIGSQSVRNSSEASPSHPQQAGSASHVIDIQDYCQSCNSAPDERAADDLSTASQAMPSTQQDPQGITTEKADWKPWK